MICRSVEFYEGESGFNIKEAKSYMKLLDPELLYDPINDDDEEDDPIDQCDSDTSSIDSVEDNKCVPFHIDVSEEDPRMPPRKPAEPEQQLVDNRPKHTGIGVTSLRKTTARAEREQKESALTVKEIDQDLLALNEYGLLARITGTLPAEIEKFRNAMMDEVQALHDLHVWEEVDVPRGTSVIGVKWVLKEKPATSLSPAKLKARLVARGFTQRYGINYEETFAPVARTASIRTVFAVCAAKGWKVRQIDVNNAYLNADMDMDGVYIKQPPYFIDPEHPKRVNLLKKGLYGTKQGGNLWFKTFTGYLTKEADLIAHQSDPCLFTTVDDEEEINSISSLYVDDALIGAPDDVAEKIIARIAKRFSIKDLGIAKHVIGIQVEQLPEGTLLTQAAYIDEIIQLTGQTDSTPLKVPMSESDPSFTIQKDDEDDDKNLHSICAKLDEKGHHKYREYIGKLMYLMVCTRPDIAFAVNFLARSCASPENRHMQSVIKLVRYLKGTRTKGLFYPARQDDEPVSVNLIGYVDAAFGDCVVTRKSTSGYLFCLNGAPLTWKSGRQSIVTTSTTEAEYIAACDGAKEAVWLRRLLEDMGCVAAEPTKLYEDNNSCIAQVENPLHHKRTKHIDIAYHFTRQMVEEDVVTMEKIDTTEQLADMLTKPLGKTLFSKHFEVLGMKDTIVSIKQ